ncbi:MAG: hypothetical protein WCR72_06515 [Bacteroidota bacterium]
MKFFAKIGLILIVPLSSGLTGCIKEQQYPVQPHIEFGSFATSKDINGKDSLGAVTISYTDGDGDIGLYSWDTVEPRKYNFYLKFLQYVNKQLVEVKPVDSSLTFNSRIPILTPSGRNKNIKGNITMALQLYFARQLLLTDTIAFEIYIKDRALNESNLVETPMFIISK